MEILIALARFIDILTLNKYKIFENIRIKGRSLGRPDTRIPQQQILDNDTKYNYTCIKCEPATKQSENIS